MVLQKLSNAAKGWASGECLEDRLPQTPHVRGQWIIRSRVAVEFWRHEARSSADGGARSGDVVRTLAEAKVADFDPPVLWWLGLDEDILATKEADVSLFPHSVASYPRPTNTYRWLDIPVGNATFVHRFDGLKDLKGNILHLLLGQASPLLQIFL